MSLVIIIICIFVIVLVLAAHKVAELAIGVWRLGKEKTKDGEGK